MIREQRQKLILDLFNDKNVVSNDEICEKANIPMTTLRRDLDYLEQIGKITKVRGGVKINKPSIEMERVIDAKLNEYVKEKDQVAKKAIKYIKNNSYVFIDAGSTTFHIAEALDAKMNLNIVTNSIMNAEVLVKKGFKNIFLLGGKLNTNLGSIVGYEAVEALKNYKFDISFIGVNGTLNGELFTTSSDQAELKNKVMENTNQNIVVATTDKVGKAAFYKFGSGYDYELITD